MDPADHIHVKEVAGSVAGPRRRFTVCRSFKEITAHRVAKESSAARVNSCRVWVPFVGANAMQQPRVCTLYKSAKAHRDLLKTKLEGSDSNTLSEASN